LLDDATDERIAETFAQPIWQVPQSRLLLLTMVILESTGQGEWLEE
jgi:hypothetical protein